MACSLGSVENSVCRSMIEFPTYKIRKKGPDKDRLLVNVYVTMAAIQPSCIRVLGQHHLSRTQRAGPRIYRPLEKWLQCSPNLSLGSLRLRFMNIASIVARKHDVY